MKDQSTLKLDKSVESDSAVTCLGMQFANDNERRAYFTEQLRQKLQDPEFRKIEGFPIGEDEDILALSDPPYYTACPNPWLAAFIDEWDAQKPPKPEGYYYHREPFAADVSEGKREAVYNAHSYHTKVPFKAIMRYILHYTEPGDIVMDSFCGTGMTGVAARCCGNKNIVCSLGLQVKSDGTILQEDTDKNGDKVWRPYSKLGSRNAMLNDLSPVATFISNNYNRIVDPEKFRVEALSILQEVEQHYGWMYQTHHDDGTVGHISEMVWADVFICNECSHAFDFYHAAVDKDTGKVKDKFACPSCRSTLSKASISRAWHTTFDCVLQKSIKQAKQVPVLIRYSIEGKRYEKQPDEQDLELITRIDEVVMEADIPTIALPNGFNTKQPRVSHGLTHVHQFYTRRNLFLLSQIRARCTSPELLLWFNSQLINVSKLNRHRPEVSFPYNPLNGTLYVGSQVVEADVFQAYRNKIKRFVEAFAYVDGHCAISTNSAHLTSCDERIDYVFIDPPFGANINYSELSFIWESWLKVFTNNVTEAIINSVQNKTIDEYRHLMELSFREAYRSLKPGRWLTVEFSNTKASVWNNIQSALSEAGFIVANVSALDKKQGSFKAVTTPTAVKQDLVISAYKPNGGFEARFLKKADSEDGVWDFVRTHLKYLPVTKLQDSQILTVLERDPRIIYDQVVAFFVRKSYPVPISSSEFQVGLAQRFIERDGMYFLPEQAAEYERKKNASEGLVQTSMFVCDEASAIQWLRQLLQAKPQVFSDLNPQYMQQLSGFNKNETQLDLKELLDQNFLMYDGTGLVPDQIHSYLSTNWKDMRNLSKDHSLLVAKAKDRWYVPDPRKAGDLEKLRERALLKEFDQYRQVRKFRNSDRFRLEAVRAGFKKAWQEKDYKTIVDIAEKIPNSVLEEDPKLLMWYDQAVTRLGA